MYDIKNPRDFLDYLYSRLPNIYRQEDKKQQNFLYRYLEVLVIAGYNELINNQYDTVETTNSAGEVEEEEVLRSIGISGLLDLIDPAKCPDDIFPYLYESFGFEYFNDIDIKYQRKFLQNVGYMNSIKGTLVEAQFVANVLTGMRNDAWYEKNQETGDRLLRVVLYAETIDDIKNIQTNGYVVEKFLKTRIPFYLVPSVIVDASTLINEDLKMAQILAINKGYTLTEKEV